MMEWKLPLFLFFSVVLTLSTSSVMMDDIDEASAPSVQESADGHEKLKNNLTMLMSEFIKLETKLETVQVAIQHNTGRIEKLEKNHQNISNDDVIELPDPHSTAAPTLQPTVQPTVNGLTNPMALFYFASSLDIPLQVFNEANDTSPSCMNLVSPSSVAINTLGSCVILYEEEDCLGFGKKYHTTNWTPFASDDIPYERWSVGPCDLSELPTAVDSRNLNGVPPLIMLYMDLEDITPFYVYNTAYWSNPSCRNVNSSDASAVITFGSCFILYTGQNCSDVSQKFQTTSGRVPIGPELDDNTRSLRHCSSISTNTFSEPTTSAATTSTEQPTAHELKPHISKAFFYNFEMSMKDPIYTFNEANDTSTRCVNFPSANVQDINTLGTCVRVYSERNCRGYSKMFRTAHKMSMGSDFYQNIWSVGPCDLNGTDVDSQNANDDPPVAMLYMDLRDTLPGSVFNAAYGSNPNCLNLLSTDVTAIDTSGSCFILYSGRDCTGMSEKFVTHFGRVPIGPNLEDNNRSIRPCTIPTSFNSTSVHASSATNLTGQIGTNFFSALIQSISKVDPNGVPYARFFYIKPVDRVDYSFFDYNEQLDPNPTCLDLPTLVYASMSTRGSCVILYANKNCEGYSRIYDDTDPDDGNEMDEEAPRGSIGPCLATTTSITQAYMGTLNSNEMTSDEMTMTSNEMTHEPCGGFINLTKNRDLIYTVPPTYPATSDVYCIWVIWASQGGPIGFTLMNNSQALLNTATSDVVITTNHTNCANSARNLKQFGLEYTYKFPYVVLIYHANAIGAGDVNEVRGFHVRLTDNGGANSSTNSNLIATTHFLEATRDTQTFANYVVLGGGGYLKNERKFIVLKPPLGHRLQFDLEFMDTEKDYDFFRLIYFDKYSRRPRNYFRLSGSSRFRQSPVKSYTGEKDEAVFLFFHSDESDERKGFRFTYSAI